MRLTLARGTTMHPAPRQIMKRSFGDSPPHPISLRVSLQIPSPTRSRIARLQGRSPSQRARIMSTPYPPHPRNWPSASGGRAGQCPRYGRLRKGTVRYGKIFLRPRCQMKPESLNSSPDSATFPVAALQRPNHEHPLSSSLCRLALSL